jgi:hypothetical protein
MAIFSDASIRKMTASFCTNCCLIVFLLLFIIIVEVVPICGHEKLRELGLEIEPIPGICVLSQICQQLPNTAKQHS